ncbi:MAG: hypothetical protein OEW23_12380 [Candidatus Aminicenantes bacterium]|nr:hypothetical protein [Candidatus Aminicenantes bacterium]
MAENLKGLPKYVPHNTYGNSIFKETERKSLWWLIKWALFWILGLLLFGVPILIF